MDFVNAFGNMNLNNADDPDDDFEDTHEASAMKTLSQKFDGDFHPRHTNLAEKWNGQHAKSLTTLREIVAAQQLNSALKGSGKTVNTLTLPPEVLADENVYITTYVKPAQKDAHQAEALLQDVQATVADMQKQFDDYTAMCAQENCQPKTTADLKNMLENAKSHVVEYQDLATTYRNTANELEQLEAQIHALVDVQQGRPPKTPVVIGSGSAPEPSPSETTTINNALAAIVAAQTAQAEAHAHIKDIHLGYAKLTDLDEQKLPAAQTALVDFYGVAVNHLDNADVQAKYTKANSEVDVIVTDVKMLWLTYYNTVRIYIEQFALAAETAGAVATNAATQATDAVSTVGALNDTASVEGLLTNLRAFENTIAAQLDIATTRYADATNNNDFLKKFADVDADNLAQADAAVAKSHTALQAVTQAQADVNSALSQAQARLDVLNAPTSDHALADVQTAANNASAAAQQASDAAQQAADQLLIAQTALATAQALRGDDATVIAQIAAEQAKAHTAATSARAAANDAQTAAGQAASYAAMAQKAAESAADPSTLIAEVEWANQSQEFATSKANEALALATSARVAADTIAVHIKGPPPPSVPAAVPPSVPAAVARAEVAGGVKALKMIMRGRLGGGRGVPRRSTLAKLLGNKQHKPRKTAARRSGSKPAKRRTAATTTPKRRKTRRA